MPHPDLIAHNAQFKKGIVKLTDEVYLAVGYAASNVHMIVGKSSITIVDTTESTKAAENILDDFRRITDKPIARIIYTHSHRDHISGATIFSDGSQPILASHIFKSDLIDLDPDAIAPNQAMGRRTQAQFGIGLPDEQRINLGCGPGDRPMQGLGQGFLPPTELIDTDTDIDLDGVQARLMLMPGETDDHMVVWMPEQKVLVCADNWYHAFPNLYAIRGTAYRDFAAWASTLGKLADLNADILAPGHTQPVFGAAKVREVLTTTQAAIMHVMKTTADGMNQGLSPDQIASDITLPAELVDKPWLKELYGKLGWSVKAFASGTLGWYDGNPSKLDPLSPEEEARRFADLAGGVDALLVTARAETGSGDPRWALSLIDRLLLLKVGEAKDLKAQNLRALAETEINATARNTYLWEAEKLDS